MIQTPDADILEGLAKDFTALAKCESTLAALNAGEKVENTTIEGVRLTLVALRACIENKQALLRSSRFRRRLARVNPKGL